MKTKRMENFVRIFCLMFICVNISCNGFSQYIPFCEKGKWGFSDTDGNITIACIYEEVDFYSDDNLAKVKSKGKYGYINKKGAIIIPFDYDDCFRIYEVYHGEHSVGLKINPAIHLNKKWFPEDVNNNRYIVLKNEKYGILTIEHDNPKVIVPFKYSKIQFDFEKEIFICSINAKTNYFNIDGQTISQEQANRIEQKESFIAAEEIGKEESFRKIVTIDGKVGIVRPPTQYVGRTNYDTLVPIIYDDIIKDKSEPLQNYIFGVKLEGKWGFAGGKKNILLPIQYDSLNFELSKELRFWEEYHRTFVVEQNDKWGILGKKNDTTASITTFLPFEFNSITKIYYSFLLVEKENKFQVFNIKSHSLINDKSYPSINKYGYESVNGFVLFQVTNKLGQTVYLGENGVEFFID